jgi:hypothetical protein
MFFKAQSLCSKYSQRLSLWRCERWQRSALSQEAHGPSSCRLIQSDPILFREVVRDEGTDDLVCEHEAFDGAVKIPVCHTAWHSHIFMPLLGQLSDHNGKSY